jgi:predicted ABC-type exoprotein transport system permease subunit
LSAGIIHDLVFRFLNPLDHKVFQALFGEIMTLLIAILALARKVIIMDMHEITASQIEALAAIALALGIVYWLMRERG